MKKLFLCIVFLLLSIPALNERVHAQGCSETNSICQEFWSEDEIFIARVIDIGPFKKRREAEPISLTPPYYLKPHAIVKLAVEKSYRKNKQKKVDVEVLEGFGKKAFDFQPGSRYLVFARRHFSEKRLSIEPCSRTRLLAEARADVDFLESTYKLSLASDVLDNSGGPVMYAGILQGKAVSLPKPAYPVLARTGHVAGTVLVWILLDETGKVIRVKALCGHPLLRAAAEEAARAAKFAPIVVSGKSVKVSTLINYNFQL
jgi:TonB family protein